ncbi:MAG: hypothetical protein NVSMB29_03790 [Candidatus Dormibacteria bacterium]
MLLGLVLALVGWLTLLTPGTPVSAGFTGSSLPGLGTGRIWDVAIDPADPNIALAATDVGVYRSANSGETWALTTLAGSRVWTVGFDQREPHPAFAGLAGRGISRSDDTGTTWADDSTGLIARDVRRFAFGLDGIAAGTSNGVAITVDGRTWRGAGLSGYAISGLAVAANSPQFTLVAGVDGGDTSKGFLFRNTGGGVTWEVLKDGLPDNGVVSSVAAGPLPQSVQKRPLLVTMDTGTYHSVDGGTTWSVSQGIPTQPTTVRLTTAAFSPLDPNLVYAGSDAGGSASGGALLRSTDGGATFSAAEDGLPKQHNTEALAVGPAAPPLVLAALDPNGSVASIQREQDTTAPAPAAQAGEPIGQPIPSVLPTPTPTLRPRTTPAPAGAGGSSGPPRFLHWPLPLAAELLVLVAIAYAAVRWRQRYLDVEGPP